jgi:LacI family transcriptional regulator
MSRITIRDIAKLLNVSPSTVSRALKDHPDIGAATKKKINQVAEDLGYQPNYQAIHFRQRKSKLIGLILPDINRFFYPDLVKAIEEITKKKGYNLIIFQSNELLEREKECVALCQNFGIEGLLVSLTAETTSLTHFNSLIQNGIPSVLVDKIIKEVDNAIVTIDDFTAAFNAVQHLAKKKYHKISGVFANKNLTITKQRKAGFKAALKKYQLPYFEKFCFHNTSKMDTKEQFKQLLNQDKRPDAVFLMTDELLSEVIQVIYETGLKIPQDIAIISISNGYLPYYLHPKVTHIKHSGYQVGEVAVNLLVDMIEHPTRVQKTQIELETYLVEMDSC